MDTVRSHLQYICSKVIPSQNFWTEMTTSGLLDAAAISAFKERSVSSQQEMAFCLLFLTSKKSHSIQDFIKLVQSTQPQLQPDQVKQMKDFMKEGWEVFREQVIKVLLSFIHTEVATHHEEQTRMEPVSSQVETEPIHNSETIRKLQKENSDLRDKIQRYEMKLQYSQSKDIQERRLLAYTAWKKDNPFRRTSATQTDLESTSHKDIDTMTVSMSENKDMQTTMTLANIEELEQKIKMMEESFRKQPDTKLKSTQTNLTLLTMEKTGEEKTQKPRRPKTAPIPDQTPSRKEVPVKSVKQQPTEKIDSGTLEVDEEGGTLELSNAAFTVPPNSVDSHVTMNAATYLPSQDQIKELEQGQVSSEVQPGKRFKLTTMPSTVIKKIHVKSKIPPDAKYRRCVPQSFMLHKTRKRRNPTETQYEDVTSVCNCNKSGADMVEYTINGCGEYQEYWAIRVELKDQEIEILKERVANLRNLGTCICDFTAFVPLAFPPNSISVSATNQDLKRKCPSIKELRQDNMKETDYQPSSHSIHHNDLLIFKKDKKTVISRKEVDMTQLRAKGQNFLISLGKGELIPTEVSIVRSHVYSVTHENDPVILCTLTFYDASLVSPSLPYSMPYQKCLKKNWCLLVDNLDVSSVLNYLFQEDIISGRQKNEIKSKHVKEEKNEKLLEILMTAGEKGFQIFCTSLDQSEGSQWLVKILRDT
ncbi:uncharacterized protein LOC106172106 [Lingula anatina]|uniref:Uncharacterized protein LOC106172106 n=1 Tax=Lingula anatina TaxID=7574 RepID=A0A1S3JCL5_LINAN|nr:uncharacterized protein LOC106172106 [Lingula anatina]|eukprot:XP_013408155.1 uncharacterized protein LOC106172106 [Lingula anatina]